jgi:hypothetical protein
VRYFADKRDALQGKRGGVGQRSYPSIAIITPELGYYPVRADQDVSKKTRPGLDPRRKEKKIKDLTF